MTRKALIFLILSACAATPEHWTAKYAADTRYLNRSNIPATVFRDPDRTSAPKGSIGPGDGGYIETCNDDASWCKLSVGGIGVTGWVNMTGFFPSDV